MEGQCELVGRLPAERAAFARVEALLVALATTPAVSLAGVAGKLDAVLREAEAWEECSAFPWPQDDAGCGLPGRLGDAGLPPLPALTNARQWQAGSSDDSAAPTIDSS